MVRLGCQVIIVFRNEAKNQSKAALKIVKTSSVLNQGSKKKSC